MYVIFSISNIFLIYIKQNVVLLIYVLIIAVRTSSMTYDIKSLHTPAHTCTQNIRVHRFPSTLRRRRQLGRELGKGTERDGSWRFEFTAFNIGKMKYDRGRRVSKEPPFCGIDKFILLPRFVGGWSNFDHRLPMCPRISITVFSNVSVF